MKVVPDAESLESLMGQASSEAAAAFGDATVYMEKYLGNPRHIEFRALATATAMPSNLASPTARPRGGPRKCSGKSEEHQFELQSLIPISVSVFRLKKKKQIKKTDSNHHNISKTD